MLRAPHLVKFRAGGGSKGSVIRKSEKATSFFTITMIITFNGKADIKGLTILIYTS